ncbi:hypothetical protein BB559_001419 [Furculomyces boomerangus]|uniref:PITH domain-containing protein n=2 Tax=Harpellales TaxID=61421 RepID=A0A2T9Z202_9FUNG|nr:hypothetical protein BB559_001419 [Furculomyces boomerangus]
MKNVETFMGADPQKLIGNIKKHSEPNQTAEKSPSFNGCHDHIDLNQFIIKKELECLNYSTETACENILMSNNTAIHSDVDEQILIHISFSQPVKLFAIKITPSKGHLEKAPKVVKLFTNRPYMGFEDTDSIEPTDTIEYTSEIYKGDGIIKARYVRFQNVSKLSIFIQDNLEDDTETVLNKVTLIGTPLQSNDFSAVTKQENTDN